MRDIDKSKGSVDLNALNVPAGKTGVKLAAYTVEKVEIDGEEYDQEVPMKDAVDEFRVIKLNGVYSLVRLKYTDERLTLTGFYSDAREENGESYYLYELPLLDKQKIQFNVSNYVKPAAGYTVKYYRTADDRNSDSNALDSMTLRFEYVTSGRVKYYARASKKEGGDSKDYNLYIDGLATLEIIRYSRSIDYDSDGYRIYSDEKIGETMHYTVRDIIPVETLFDSVDGECAARDSRYNYIAREDYTVVAPTAGTTLSLFFYGADKAKSDCDEYNSYTDTYGYMGETVMGWTLSSSYDKCGGGAVILPAAINEVKVYSASFDYSTMTALYVSEGMKEFNVQFIGCNDLTDVYLPASITDIRSRAFGGINTDAVIHCAFPASKAEEFESFWNSLVGSYDTYTTEYNSAAQIKSGGLIFGLNGSTAVVKGVYDENEFNGKIPATIDLGGKQLNVTEIADLGGLASFEIGKNVARIADAVLASAEAITVADGNTAFVGADGALYTADHAKLVFIDVDASEVVLDARLKSIADGILMRCAALKKITVIGEPDCIDANTFDGCTSITEISVPMSMLSFFDLSQLTSIELHSGTQIDDYAFYQCQSLQNVALASGFRSIGRFAFYQCRSLQKVVLPDGLSTISASAFESCSSLTEINIPSGVTEISEGAFEGCVNLEQIEIPDSVTSIGGHAFEYCTSLKSIVISFANTNFGENVYRDCSALEKITVTSGAIPDNMFENFSVTEVVIGEKVTGIGKSAFGNCNSLKTLKFNAVDCAAAIEAFNGCIQLTELTLGNGVRIIPDGLMSGCTALASVKIPATVTKIGASAFKDCTALTNVIIPASVATIGEYAFGGCSRLSSVTIPNGVTQIETEAFAYTGLTSVVVPDSVEYLYEGVFAHCDSLVNITIPFIGFCRVGENDAYQYPFGYIFGELYGGIEQRYFHSEMHGEDVIAYGIPSSLRSVTVTGGRIVMGAFMNCKMLTSITLPNNVTEICEYAFQNCTGLKSITLPKTVKTIDRQAFYGCTDLAEFIFSGTTTQWNNINAGYNWAYNAPFTVVKCSNGNAEPKNKN